MTHQAEPPQPDMIELSIPVRADLVVLARLTAATVASRADFAVEEIEDLRLAVEELCLSLVRKDGGGRLHFAYRHQEDAIEIECTLEPDLDPEADRLPGSGDYPADALSLRILDALVDEHGQDLRDGRLWAWLRKRKARSSVG